ncbi:hypothetical protein F5B22DRAFT_661076 [Xylaria bambusicola]|uniref:uncharacterized protein n=1 Tax=Xylaria bambusicola TaxID=326684 RepID=UPI002008ACA5|nr:uncharacterized protein F5B22DRAFT_661076 [Xylaria bambusicola]KAI0505755.1 hypothetical protein F5B22DRAFT_661076 [Xylaria bambusicola]
MEPSKQLVMTDSVILDALVDEFTCAICLDVMDEPRTGCPWGHTFCKKVSLTTHEASLVQDEGWLTLDLLQCLETLTRYPMCQSPFTREAIYCPTLGSRENTLRDIEPAKTEGPRPSNSQWRVAAQLQLDQRREFLKAAGIEIRG